MKNPFFSALVLLISSSLMIGRAAETNAYFKIRVVDAQTGRGVPLVELYVALA